MAVLNSNVPALGGSRGLVAAGSMLLTLVTAVAVGVGLTALSEPSDLGTRRAAIERAAQDAVTANRVLQRPARFPARAICTQSASAADRLTALLTTKSKADLLQLGALSVSPPHPVQESGQLVALDLKLSATGDYDDVMRFVTDLEEARPAIFVDQLDLTSKVNALSIDVTARAYCLA